MNARTLTAPALVLALASFAGPQRATAQYQGPPPPPPGGQGYGPGQGGWDAPPGEYRDIQRQGFHDGIDAARRDFQHQQRPDPAQHMEFRHPHVPPEARDDYREAFRKGYFTAMHHMQGGGPEGPR